MRRYLSVAFSALALVLAAHTAEAQQETKTGNASPLDAFIQAETILFPHVVFRLQTNGAFSTEYVPGKPQPKELIFAKILSDKSAPEAFGLKEAQRELIVRVLAEVQKLEDATVQDSKLEYDRIAREITSELGSTQLLKVNQVYHRRLAAVLGVKRVMDIAESTKAKLSPEESQSVVKAEEKARLELLKATLDLTNEVNSSLTEPLSDEQRATLDAEGVFSRTTYFPELIVVQIESANKFSANESWLDEWGRTLTLTYAPDGEPKLEQKDLGSLHNSWTLLTQLHSSQKLQEELQISPDQRSEFDDLGKQIAKRYGEFMRQEEKIDRLLASDELGKWLKGEIERELLPHQSTILRTMAMRRGAQRRGLLFELRKGSYREGLSLSSRQLEQIASAGEKATETLRKKSIELENEFYETLRSEASPASRKKLERVFGTENLSTAQIPLIGILGLPK